MSPAEQTGLASIYSAPALNQGKKSESTVFKYTPKSDLKEKGEPDLDQDSEMVFSVPRETLPVRRELF